MTRLTPAALDAVPQDIARPAYDRSVARAGVVHLGIGAFHRAHQAVVFDDLMAAGDPRWMVRAASLRSPTVRDQLAPQDGLYTLVERDGAGERLRVIGAVRDVLVAPEDPAALVEALAAAYLVTLTITEKGYHLDPASGGLREDDPAIAAEAAGGPPTTAPGFLVAALAQRRERGLTPFTALSCDNLPANGRRLEAAVVALARRRDPALADWIARQGAFPVSMVDRIVPATTPADIDALEARTSLRDEAMVKAEPFTQWVIEDCFAGARPDFAAVGVQITADVAPWEEAKLRLLNGAHSGLAYLGALAGFETMDGVVAQAPFAAFAERLWDEAADTLCPPPGLDIPAYRRQLAARFANPALSHRTRQIAMDGSQKLPQRLLNTIAERLARGRPIDALALAVAGWMRWQAGRDETGRTFVVDDPLAARTVGPAQAPDPAEAVAGLLGLEAIFPPALAADPAFRAPLIQALTRLRLDGAARTVQRLAEIR